MLKKIGLVLLVLLVGLAAAIAMQPSGFQITRSKQIEAPPGVVYLFVYDFHHWAQWSPWEKLDPSMKKTFAGPGAGQGASYAWVGSDEVGEGRMTITSATSGHEVNIRLEFLKPFQATNETVFLFENQGTGSRVTWSMSGKNDFLGKAFSLFFDVDSRVGADFDKGLEALKAVAEAEVKRQADQQAAQEAEFRRRMGLDKAQVP